MSERDDGGPAFPGSLRDWFAGQALVGMAPVVCKPGCQYEPQEGDPRSVEEFTAAVVYSLADAMLAERAKAEPAGATQRKCETCGGAGAVNASADVPSGYPCNDCEGTGSRMERGQAPDEPAAEGRTDHAASPAPASSPHCLNCGLILDSARDYCLVCGCSEWLFSQRESDIKCTLRAGHDGDHLNGGVSWGGSS